MKRLLIVFLVFCSINVIAQNKESEQKLTRKEKRAILKKERAVADSVNQLIIQAIIENKQFVLEADQLKDRKGNSVFVMSNINFIAVDTAVAVFQFGSAHTVGVNGVGGVTIEGRISSFEVKMNEKHGSYYLQFHISSNLGMFDISMSVSANGNASATVNTMRGGKLHYSGRLVPLQKSTVFKGSSF